MNEMLQNQQSEAEITVSVQAKKRHKNKRFFALLVLAFIGLGLLSGMVGGVLGARAGTGDPRIKIDPLVGVWQAVDIQVGNEAFPVGSNDVQAELFADQSGWVELSQEARALSFTWEYHKMESGCSVYTVHYRDGRQAKMTYFPTKDEILLMTDRQSGLMFRRAG